MMCNFRNLTSEEYMKQCNECRDVLWG